MEIRETTMGDIKQDEIINTDNAIVDNEIKAEEAIDPPAPTLNENVVLDEPVKEVVVDAPIDENEVAFTSSIVDDAVGENDIIVGKDKPAPAPVSWQEAIKNVDRKEIAKALGISEFALELNEHLSKGGKATDYLNAKAVDYNSVPDTDLIKEGLRKTIPTATDAQLDLYIQKKYNQNEFADDDDKEFGLLQMQADAHNLRQAKIAEQKSFKIPENAPIPANQQEWEQAQKDAQEKQDLAIQQQRDYFLNHEATKALMDSKRVAVNIGEGVAPLKFSFDNPAIVMKAILDGDFYSKVTSNEKGEPNVQKLQRIAMVALDDNYEKKIYNAGLMAGKKTLVEENQNIKKPTGGTIVPMNKEGVFYKGETTLGALSNR